MNDINFWDTNVEVGYYNLNFRNGLKKNKGIRSNWHKITFEEVKENLNLDLKHLDYACGPGTFLGHYINKESVGYDASEKQIQYAKNNYPKHKFTLDLKEVEDNCPYDSISVIGLIEFLTDEEISGLITNLKSMLKPGGIIIFTTPNFNFSMRFAQWLFDFKSELNYKSVTINKHTKKSLLRKNFVKEFENIEIYKILNFGIVFSIFNHKMGKFFHDVFNKLLNKSLGLLLVIKVKV